MANAPAHKPHPSRNIARPSSTPSKKPAQMKPSPGARKPLS